MICSYDFITCNFHIDILNKSSLSNVTISDLCTHNYDKYTDINILFVILTLLGILSIILIRKHEFKCFKRVFHEYQPLVIACII